MKTKYMKAFEGYINFIEEIKRNLELNNGKIMIKNRKFSKVKDLKNRAFLSFIKEEDKKVIELAHEQALIGAKIVDEIVLVEKTSIFKGKSFQSLNGDIKMLVEEYETHLYKDFKPFLEIL